MKKSKFTEQQIAFALRQVKVLPHTFQDRRRVALRRVSVSALTSG